MKRTVLFFAIALLYCSAFSQETEEKTKTDIKPQFGFRVGYNISNLDFDPQPTMENKHRNGFVIGFYAEYFLSPAITIAPEIMYSAEGGKHDALRVDYVHLPVLLKFRFGERFAAGVGPQASVKVHEHEDGFKNFVFSGLAGIEYNLWEDYYIDLRYNYGFMNILDNDLDLEAKNHNIQIGFGMKI
ncbi:MAG TPA: porin family protein [Flavobacteriaceae bacterium]|nr:porin family protein [Flavobacteriaceae bacterium]